MSDDQESLFGDELPPDPPPLSADRRRTLRQRADVARGIHPLTGGRARPDLGTCGSCALRTPGGMHAWPKCTFGAMTIVRGGREQRRPGPYETASASTDVRAWWPACPQFKPLP